MTDWEPLRERRKLIEGEVVVETYERYAGEDNGVQWTAKYRDFKAYGIQEDRDVARDVANEAYDLLIRFSELSVQNLVYPAPRGAEDVDMTCNGRCVLCDEHRDVACFHPRSEIVAFVRGARSRRRVDNGVPF
jgi:hypothetical protein